MKRKRIFSVIKLLLALYCLLGIGLYYGQERLLFRPVVVAPEELYAFQEPFTEFNLRLDAETNFNVIRFHTKDTAKGVVLYFHGNRENVKRYAPFAKHFTRNGYEVWMADYPGYGKSTGKMSEALLYEEALQVYKRARAEYPPNKIILYGKSIGTGIAAQLASVRDCRELLLETPYFSMVSLVRRVLWMYPLDLLMQYRFPTNEYLKKVTAPVTILHGTDDGLIAYDHALQLKKVLKPGDVFVELEKGKHNNLHTFPLFQQTIDRVLQR